MKLGIVGNTLVEGVLLTILGFVYLYGFAMNKNWAYHLIKRHTPRILARVLGIILGSAFLIIGIEKLFTISRILSGSG